MSQTEVYVLHIGVRVTNKVLWTMISDLDGVPLRNFPNVEAAIHWLYLRDVREVAWRSGNYTGTMTLDYDEIEEARILYHVGTVNTREGNLEDGENHSPYSIVRSERS